ncbi:MAG: hypothetical protein AVDCRST_MAG79-2939 [uncultured Thermoleophilia bacterium]|uniref:RNA polymerase ECF-type sigma factor n=1 Tax=uncultured Thermoleophilia bacterium TaxID=1497501 RepID=A0A6J4UNT9_9ACTN|nr:MAG: hypothetical protein AVDCRST_MAG79-2939 [uncultured Thermoleophilia bacterium]
MALPGVTNGKAPARPSLEDAAGFADAYRTHSKAILIFLARRTYDPETALDLTAETFARAYAGRRRFRGTSHDELAAWLFAIARHVLARFLRRGVAERRALTRLGIEVPSLEPDDLARVVELAGLADLRLAAAQGFSMLSAKEREAVRLRVVEELPYGDVARRLDISVPTARARVSRGLRALAGVLGHRPLTQETSA